MGVGDEKLNVGSDKCKGQWHLARCFIATRETPRRTAIHVSHIVFLLLFIILKCT